jgi:putative ATP-dependent endonuclease of OLD family
MPKASVKLTEDGYPSSVARTGHGLQRAFILTMLQHLVLTGRAAPASALSSESASQVDANSPGEALPTPNLVLAIEEPGLYQHPNRQRHLSKILFALASGTIQGVARATQVIYCTHSPFFVGIDRFEQLRLLRKRRTNGSGPKTTSIARAQLDEIARLLWEAEGKPGAPFTAETLRPRLQSVMTPWVNEGFFAQVTVLVEGEDDRAAVLGAAAAQGHDFESLGISVIPCMGKNNLDRPAVIFRALDIPTYVIWDSDHHKSDAKPEDNKRLLKLLAKPEIEWPAFVSNDSACFETDLETTLREEIGAETFDSLLQNAQQEFGISSKDRALKNPIVVQRVMAGAQGQGKSSTTLKAMVERIVALRPAETTG